jgi:hypothetical protein
MLFLAGNGSACRNAPDSCRKQACRQFRVAPHPDFNALVLLDEGWSCQQVAHALLLDDDTIRSWRKLFEQRGIEGITSFDVGGSASYLSVKQEDDLKAWVLT